MDFIEKLKKASEIHNNIKKSLTKDFILNNTIIQIANHIENEISNRLQNEINNGISHFLEHMLFFLMFYKSFVGNSGKM